MSIWTNKQIHIRVLITALYLFAVLTWTLPKNFVPFKAEVNAVFAPVLLFTNLWQTWDMFAPNPRSDDIWTDVIYTDDQGREGRWILTKMNDMPYLERWQKERWRKYFNDHLRTDAEHHLWQPFAEYAARSLEQKGIHVTTLTLRRWWRPAVHPVSAALRPDVRADNWNHFDFYTWNAPRAVPR